MINRTVEKNHRTRQRFKRFGNMMMMCRVSKLLPPCAKTYISLTNTSAFHKRETAGPGVLGAVSSSSISASAIKAKQVFN